MTHCEPSNTISNFSRRKILGIGAGAVLVTSVPISAFATPEHVREAQRVLFGDHPIAEGNVRVKLPPIAENGYSVPIDIAVDSPMTSADHVTQIAIFSPRNPIALIAKYQLGPFAGRAILSTRIRLAGTQILQVIAETSTGHLWSGTAKTVVTLAACIVL